MDPRMFTDKEFRKAAERCADCPDKEKCDVFKNMMSGGLIVQKCPFGRANVI